jgi:hypothetical protein
LGVVNVITGDAPHRITLVDASELHAGGGQTKVAATRIRHIPPLRLTLAQRKTARVSSDSRNVWDKPAGRRADRTAKSAIR